MDLPLYFSLTFAWIEPQRAPPGKQPSDRVILAYGQQETVG